MNSQSEKGNHYMTKGVQAILARNAKRLRVLKGKSQRDMSLSAGVSQKTISNLEWPESPISPKLSTVEAVARYFKLHPAILLIDDVPDDALTDRDLGAMIEDFVSLPHRRKRQIMDLIADFKSINDAD